MDLDAVGGGGDDGGVGTPIFSLLLLRQDVKS